MRAIKRFCELAELFSVTLQYKLVADKRDAVELEQVGDHATALIMERIAERQSKLYKIRNQLDESTKTGYPGENSAVQFSNAKKLA